VRCGIAKVLTRPRDQSEGVLDALLALGESGGRVGRLVHGTTAVTNLLLERTGARVALCATEGHTDVLHLRRQDRAALYDLSAHHPAPLVARGDAVAVPERMAPGGVVRALDAAGIARVVDAVRVLAPEAVAVSLLHAYAHDTHERALAAALAEALPAVDVVRSGDVHPEIREYERTSTTVAEAYARPRVRRYLERLAGASPTGGFPAPGRDDVGRAACARPPRRRARRRRSRSAARRAASWGAAAVLRAVGRADGAHARHRRHERRRGAGRRRRAAGGVGGEVAGRADRAAAGAGRDGVGGGGEHRVGGRRGRAAGGPAQRRREPGPAAFGRGGTEATVTDAHLRLGHLGAERMSGGVRLDAAASAAALASLDARLGGAGDDGAARAGDDRRRRRGHGPRAAPGERGARARPAAHGAGRVRRRRSAARVRARRAAGDAARAGAAARRRAERRRAGGRARPRARRWRA
jgi:N-methylhydantoinase A